MANRTWLITGVSSGFGRAMTSQLLAQGQTVIERSVISKRYRTWLNNTLKHLSERR